MRYLILCFLLIPLCVTAGEQYVAGVLRNTGDGWHALNEATHEPLNIALVANDARAADHKEPTDGRNPAPLLINLPAK